MASMSYKCPNCGGGLKFDPASQKFKCEYCLSVFTEEEMRKIGEEARARAGAEPPAADQEPGAGPTGPWAAVTDGWPGQSGSEESGADGRPGQSGAVVYTCPNCGAEIVADPTTAATFCYYCHNPVVLSGRLSGEFLPDYVIPFSMDKKEATRRFLDWVGKKKFIPKDFFSEEQIEKLSGIYFPYLLYSCQVDGKLNAEAEQNRTWMAGNIRYTEHKKYQVERAGCLDVKNLTRNALSKSNKELVEGVLPFDMEKLQPFEMGYLSGFQAEKRDMDSQVFTPEAEQEVREYTVWNLRNAIDGYASVNVKNSDTRIRDARWQYALLPVWVLTYRDRPGDKMYYFAMNGQTGKIWGRLPVDRRKLAGLFAGVFIPVFAFLMIGGWFL